MHHFTALVTLAAVLFYFFTSTRVARARVAYGVKLPAISGNPDFERVFRVQMNTLEWLPIFLPLALAVPRDAQVTTNLRAPMTTAHPGHAAGSAGQHSHRGPRTVPPARYAEARHRISACIARS